MSNQRILVMGGGGFLGTHLCNQLAFSGYTVRAFGRSRSKLLSKNVEFIYGNFENTDEVRAALIGQDCVYHLIHGTNPPNVNNDITGDILRSINPTISLLSQCSEYRFKKIIFISSGGTVYGNNGIVASREDDPTMPIGAYGAHKLLIENYLRVFFATKQLDYLIFRLSNPYGPLQSTSKGIGLIRAVIDAVRNNRPVNIYGDGETQRDYIYIEDAVRAMETAMSYKGTHKIFNIGSGEGKSINEVITLVEQVMKVRVNKKILPDRNFDVRKSVLDISLAKSELNLVPNTDLKSGINFTVNSL
ncbi:NAD-dependent epimerase/dehydratase family protein [Ochrobactrum sp. Marseille-Q0166]|uniref:NAD-dependent epimerase/dehydratase family protein n=1 Tax=Ochrobactrum sp. Marseille-Q0166 TaxID=2761105 RepID=UPI0016559BED|nr:NAD-dependent epimerase/dehydratase family protein [Ochrobactrum sp. Marseille-Q0166]MBC8719032.1 NAD-dependent epimerase/dehydratase family protein [Ochrobactrum sp. Marseille-Q0166]